MRSSICIFLVVAAFGLPTAGKADSAIAVGRTTESKWRYYLAENRPTKEIAENEAYSSCREQHFYNGTCRIAVLIRPRECGAFARSPHDHFFGAGVGLTIDVAARIALHICELGSLSSKCEVSYQHCARNVRVATTVQPAVTTQPITDWHSLTLRAKLADIAHDIFSPAGNLFADVFSSVIDFVAEIPFSHDPFFWMTSLFGAAFFATLICYLDLLFAHPSGVGAQTQFEPDGTRPINDFRNTLAAKFSDIGQRLGDMLPSMQLVSSQEGNKIPTPERKAPPAVSTAELEAEPPSTKSVEVEEQPSTLPMVIPQAVHLDEELPPSQPILLKLKRSQKQGAMGGKIYMLDARIDVSAEVRSLIGHHNLGSRLIYESAARQKHAERTKAHLEATRGGPSLFAPPAAQAMGAAKTFWKLGRAAVSAARASLALRVTVNSLLAGVHVECKSMDELMEAEDAFREAKGNLEGYIETLQTFDGREEVV